MLAAPQTPSSTPRPAPSPTARPAAPGTAGRGVCNRPLQARTSGSASGQRRLISVCLRTRAPLWSSAVLPSRELSQREKQTYRRPLFCVKSHEGENRGRWERAHPPLDTYLSFLGHPGQPRQFKSVPASVDPTLRRAARGWGAKRAEPKPWSQSPAPSRVPPEHPGRLTPRGRPRPVSAGREAAAPGLPRLGAVVPSRGATAQLPQSPQRFGTALTLSPCT